MQTEGDSSLKRFQRLQVLRVSSTPLAPPDASIREKTFCGFLRNFWMLGSGKDCCLQMEATFRLYRSLKGEVWQIRDFKGMLYPTFLHWLLCSSSKLMPCLLHQFASGMHFIYIIIYIYKTFDLSSPTCELALDPKTTPSEKDWEGILLCSDLGSISSGLVRWDECSCAILSDWMSPTIQRQRHPIGTVRHGAGGQLDELLHLGCDKMLLMLGLENLLVC